LAPRLDEITAEAFSVPAPLVSTNDPRLQLLELFWGRTAAFKDFGAAFLAASLERLGVQRTTVLVATSGDTGGAVAGAFVGRPWARVVVLYPDGRVSPRQAHQLEAFGGNVVTLRVDGSFDDCQALVKGAFGDADLRAEVPMTSANSISLGRLLPQMAYHAHAVWSHHAATGRPLGLVVPTGNLGNALAAWMVGAMGLPVAGVVLATNANEVLARWVHTGIYEPTRSVPTLANAMDVGAPSNLERLLALQPLREGPPLHAHSADDEAIGAMVGAAPERYGHVVCPHTAAGLVAYEALDATDEGDWVVAATAHPAKFETVVEPRVGHAVEVPEALAELLERPRHGEAMQGSPEALARVLRSDRGFGS
jgi:threonine synthase